MIKKIFTGLSCFIFILVYSGYSQTPDITINELKDHIYFLASDSLRGRKPGTEGSKKAADYILKQFSGMKVKLPGEDGFQYFDVVKSIEAGENNHLIINEFTGELHKDYTPLAFSENKSVKAKTAFAGYGFDFDADSVVWHDFQDIDVSGRWVLLLLGDPEMDNPNSLFANYSSMRQKVMIAGDHGAAGVLFVSGEEFDAKDELLDISFDQSESTAGLPVLHIKRDVADQLLKENGTTVNELEKYLNENRKPKSFLIDLIVDAETGVEKKYAKTQNVAAFLEGNDPRLKDEVIVIGAHYDHLGMGGPGSGSRRPDTTAIHNGADDNASGVAALVEIFERLAVHRQELKRSILGLAFDAEEMGRLGSKYFIEHPLVDLQNIDIMINLDMVGRLDSVKRTLSITGSGTAEGLEDQIKKYGEEGSFELNISPDGFGPSDHASFYVENIPVLMLFSGVHDDYHTPDDDAKLIHYNGLKDIADLVYDLVFDLANRDDRLVFREAGPKSQPNLRRRFRVTLGIMPDHTAPDIKGLRTEGVIKGRPADLAGMKKGDVIVALEGKPVTNIYDYMYRLAEFKSGQTISVEVLRNGGKEILIVQL
ncbi:M20/M25/M40 family metallo-hydrolase [candidate division KSB1 bacterium]|nr:M20/M25/M40 family metallo-hydrolase [candidate division KSB1 bacterium]